MKHPLLKFFALTYTVTWSCWLLSAAVARSHAAVSTLLAEGLFLLGTFAPGLVGLLLTYLAQGPIDTRTLLGRVFKWQVSARWYLFAVGYIPAIKLAAAVGYRVVTGAWPQFGRENWFLMAAAVAVSTWVQAGEEIGWRGYALSRLAARVGLGPASLIVGAIWATWHLPLFFFSASDLLGQSFPLYLLQVTALSVAAAWLYWRTDGSLLMVMLLHAAVNNTKDIVPSASPQVGRWFMPSSPLIAWFTVVLLWLTAAYFLVCMRRRSQVDATSEVVSPEF